MEQWYKCPKCNQDILYGANPCPHCKSFLAWSQQGPVVYTPPINVPQQQIPPILSTTQEPKKRKSPKLSLIAIGIVVVLFIGTCSILANAHNKDVATQNAQAIEQQSEQAIPMSATALYNAYESNQVAADLEYKGKLLKVTGIVNRIGTDLSNNPYVVISASTSDIFGVQCTYPQTLEYQQLLATLRKGQTVTVTGRCTGYILNVLLEHE
ncbi:MAG: hypothetical protein WB588_02175 [Dehalococcoidia bacterium]